jgi:hypothetical protein
MKSCMQIDDLLNAHGNALIRDIQSNLASTGTNATEETSNSLQIAISQEGTKYKLTLTGRPFFFTVQTGRRPTPDKRPSKEMISNISRWVNARGIDLSAVWGIATNIQKKGTKLWQAGGRTDIVDPAVDAFINETSDALLNNEAETFKIKIQELQW